MVMIMTKQPIQRTKWDILMERRDSLQAQLDRANAQLDSLYQTDCGLSCSGCGMYLHTEADFAAHFTIYDERYLNLGGCPNNPRPHTRA